MRTKHAIRQKKCNMQKKRKTISFEAKSLTTGVTGEAKKKKRTKLNLRKRRIIIISVWVESNRIHTKK